MFVILSLVSCFMFIILKYVFITHIVLFSMVAETNYYELGGLWDSLVAQTVNSLPAMW